jgi:hypothetical protein
MKFHGSRTGRIQSHEPNLVNVPKSAGICLRGDAAHRRFNSQRRQAAYVERTIHERLAAFKAAFPGVVTFIAHDEVMLDLTRVEARCLTHVQSRVAEGRTLGGAMFVASELKEGVR